MIQTDIRIIAETLRAEFEEEGVATVEINLGLCSDFADALEAELSNAGVLAEIYTLDYFWSDDGGIDPDALKRRSAFTLPPGLTWEVLTRLDFANAASHTWVEVDGKCIDAESTAGEETPFNLRCVRHALTEIVGDVMLRSLTEEHEWWRKSLAIRKEREALFPQALADMPRTCTSHG